jgi:hypothetical protein
MRSIVPLVLRGVIILLVTGSLVVQVLLPGVAAEIGDRYHEVTHLAVPYAVLAILAVVCVQVALVAVWRLLVLVEGGTIFTRDALRPVDVIIGCGAVATLLTIGVMLHLGLVVRLGGPGIGLVLAAGSALGVAFVLLMVVMRGLLTTATSYRTELAEVI